MASADRSRPPRRARADRGRTRPRRNRRRGAPRSLLFRRALALALAVCAALLAVRDRATTSAAPSPAAAQPAPAARVLPLVLAVDDAATVAVLRAGDLVDVYAAYDDQPPALAASALPLLEVSAPDQPDSISGARTAHVVVGITPDQVELVGILLAAQYIVATVSAVPNTSNEPAASPAKETHSP